MTSIRRYLLVALLVAVTTVMLLGAFAMYRMAREEADEIFDYHLRQVALSLRDQAFESAVAPKGEADEEDFDFVIQVWDREGVRLYYSHPHSALPDHAQLGFSTIQARDGAWRVFTAQLRGQTIQVAQPMSVRNELAAEAALRTLMPFFILLPVLGVLIWVVVGCGLSPLAQIAQAVTARTPAALDPLSEQRAPEEVQPLVHALNDLLARLKSAMEAQRDFIADAAHELRTPLAALQLQVQLVKRATDAQERTETIAELEQGLQRTIHAVQQLLTLARQEPGEVERPFAPVKFGELVRLVVAEHIRLAEARQIDLGVSSADNNVLVQGDADALRILIANLVENAIRYTPAGGKVDVSVGIEEGRPFAEVADTGPGIPPEDRERVFDRFYRRAGTEETGSGLGLAIVKAIAESHGATVTLGETSGGGVRARIEFVAMGAT
ncbi:MAG: ATP-binding protein [Gammaproteobacteria bacterium]